jgi:SAM-dependent methyltransferase
MSKIDRLLHILERDAGKSRDVSLQPAERLLLNRIRGRHVRMLDIGVGAGRTAFTFAPLCTEYIGIDIAPRMVEHSRQRIGESPSVSFRIADVQDLSEWAGARFDVVLFSHNGLDYLDHEGRRRALGQIRSVIADDGIFCVSSHNLEAFPFSPKWPEAARRTPVRWALRLARSVPHNLRLQKVNRDHDTDELRSKGWAELHDGGHNFEIPAYHVLPEIMERQLQAAGFRLDAAYSTDAVIIDVHAPPRDPWITYFATPL